MTLQVIFYVMLPSIVLAAICVGAIAFHDKLIRSDEDRAAKKRLAAKLARRAARRSNYYRAMNGDLNNTGN